MNINNSQYHERFVKIGVSCDEKGKDPQICVRPRVHHMDQSELEVPQELNWAHCVDPHAPQIFGNNGEKFEDGLSGIGQTPNWFGQGTMLATMKVTATGQETIVLGAIPTMG